MNYQLILKHILETLASKKIIKEIQDVSFRFYDEPKLYLYSCQLNNSSFFRKRGYIVDTRNSAAGGISFTSAKVALLKCLSEAIERFCQFCFKKERIIFTSYKELKNNRVEALNPAIYKDDKMLQEKVFGWIEGYNLTKKVNCLIPAQLIYLNYHRVYKEKTFTTIISTGAASRRSASSAILTGLYEVIERDAIMTNYLNKISAPLLDLDGIKFYSVKKLIESCHRYNLQVYIFDVSSDLNVPVMMTVVVDRTAFGPAITVGSKASFNVEEAILGSIEEALMPRPWIRRQMLLKNRVSFNIDKYKIDSSEKMYLFWSDQKLIKELAFLLNQKPTAFTYKTVSGDEKVLLQKIINSLSEKGYQIYYAEITLPEIANQGFSVYKVVIPKLQPLYIDQTKKEINIKRLQKVANCFNKEQLNVNKFPHPFP